MYEDQESTVRIPRTPLNNNGQHMQAVRDLFPKKQNIDISKELENEMLVEKYSQKLKAMRDIVNENPFD